MALAGPSQIAFESFWDYCINHEQTGNSGADVPGEAHGQQDFHGALHAFRCTPSARHGFVRVSKRNPYRLEFDIKTDRAETNQQNLHFPMPPVTVDLARRIDREN